MSRARAINDVATPRVATIVTSGWLADAAAIAALTWPLISPGAPPVPGGNAEAGKAIYQRCIGCHSLDRNRTGPRHCGLIGRKAGALPGFEYSEAMRNSNLVWDVATLNRFLTAPMDVVPGTSMGFVGVRDEQARRDLVAYLAAVNRDEGECDNNP